MPTSSFTSTDILKHPVLIDTQTWTEVQTPGTILSSYSIPAIFADIDNFHARMLQVYAYFKPTVTLRFLINSTKFHQGKLIAFYDPMEATVISVDTLNKRPRNIYMATGQPNVLLDAGYSNTGVLEIPFEHVLSYMTTNSTERAPQMGTVYLMVLNSLMSATGATPELDVQIMLSCADVELHIPMRPHTVQLISSTEPFKPEGVPMPSSHTNMALAPKQFMGGVKPKPSSGFRQVVDSTINTIKTIPDCFYNFATGNWNGLGGNLSDIWDQTVDRFEGGLKMLGMDKPAALLTKTENMLSTTAPLAHMKGVDGSIRLAATQSGGYTQMNFSAANEDEMNIKEVIKTKMMFNQLAWDTTQPAGATLLQIPVHPGICFTSPSSARSGYTVLNPTFLSYFSLAYEQWHGSINFRFDFTATQFHTGRVVAVFEPNSSTTGALANLDLYTNNPSHLFDLHENKTFEINIPFVSSTPRKNTVNPTAASLIAQDDENSLGILYLFVYTPLAVTNNVPNTIPINCYISAGDDFVFEVPRLRDDIFYPDDTAIPPITTPFRPEAGGEALPLRSEDRTSPPSIIKGSGVISSVCHYNEEIGDVRDYARRYYKYRTYSAIFSTDPSNSGNFYVQGQDETTLIALPQYNVSAQNPLAFVSNLYTFWSGALRYKIYPYVRRSQTLKTTVVNALGKLAGSPMLGTGGFSFLQSVGNSYPHQIQNSSQDSSTEVEIPFYSFYNQFVTNPVQTTGNYNDLIYGSGSILYLFETDTPTDFPASTLTFDLYIAAGDDFKLRFLVSPPSTLIITRT